MKARWLVTLGCACAVVCGPSNAAAFKADATAKPLTCLKLVDSQDRVVGTVAGVFPGVVAFAQVDKAVYPLGLVGQQLQGLSDDLFQGPQFIVFTTPDCTGTPYLTDVAPPKNPGPPYVRTVVAGSLLYAQIPGTSVDTFVFQSTMLRDDPTCYPCTGPCLGSSYGVPAQVVLNLGQFVAPFQILPCQ